MLVETKILTAGYSRLRVQNCKLRTEIADSFPAIYGQPRKGPNINQRGITIIINLKMKRYAFA